jgi:hypothetical protein
MASGILIITSAMVFRIANALLACLGHFSSNYMDGGTSLLELVLISVCCSILITDAFVLQQDPN